MSARIEIKVPDIGDSDDVEVIELLVSVGDQVAVDDSLISLESDKASMEVPSTHAGEILELKVAVGDQVSTGSLIAVLEADEANEEESKEDAPVEDPAGQFQNSDEQASDVQASDVQSEGDESESDEQTSADIDCDVVVLGAGPGGYTAAFRAADLGLKVVLVERYASLGGVCLNVGCIPSKALLHMAEVVESAAAFAEHGVRFGEPEIDLDGLRDWKQSVVDKLTGGLKILAKQRKVEVVHGVGRFSSSHRLTVTSDDQDGAANTDDSKDDSSSTTIAFEHAIIAAGSRPFELPGLPYDDDRLIDSTGALELRDVPERLLVIGGGIIGLEMATVYHALGSAVTVVELLDGLMPGADRDIVKPFQRHIDKRYERILLATKVTRLEARDDGLEAFFASDDDDAPESAIFDRVLLAVGRRPNGGDIGAEAAGVTVDERGFIAVDRQQRTNVDHIFAIGDVVGQPMLAHKATHEGKVAAEVIAGENSYFDARVIPSVAYTDPEVAWVGVTETSAKAAGTEVEKATFPWSASGRALALGRGEGLTKLLFDADGKLVGAGIVGPGAGELIAEVGLAIEMGCDAHDIGLTIHAHPTLSETVAMSAEAFAGTLTDLYMPKRRAKSREQKS